VSEHNPGEGWWQASDTKWYPPWSRPGQPLPPPPQSPPRRDPDVQLARVQPSAPVESPAHQPRWPSDPPAATLPTVSGALAAWLQGLLWTVAALWAAAALVFLATISAAQDWLDAPAFSDTDELQNWIDVEDAAVTVRGLGILAWLATFVLLIVWMHSAYRSCQRLRPAGTSWTPGWTVGGWFLPLGNLLIPGLVLSEIDKVASTRPSGGHVGAKWKDTSTGATTIGFFGFLVGSLVISLISGGLIGDETSDLTFSEYRGAYLLAAIGCVCMVISALCGVAMVRRLSPMLSTTALQAPQHP
jgi:hypothetical protein